MVDKTTGMNQSATQIPQETIITQGTNEGSISGHGSIAENKYEKFGSTQQVLIQNNEPLMSTPTT